MDFMPGQAKGRLIVTLLAPNGASGRVKFIPLLTSWNALLAANHLNTNAVTCHCGSEYLYLVRHGTIC